LAVAVSAGQRHESSQFLPVFEAFRLPRTSHRARYRPDRLAGDMAYNVEWIRAWLHRRGIEAVIPRRGKERPPEERFDREAYRRRNIIERCIGWLKECRRLMSRFEKSAISYLAFLKLAILQRLLRNDFSDGT